MSAEAAIARIEALADRLAKFDILEDEDVAKIPSWVDVPDDYEGGLHAAARFIRNALNGSEDGSS